MFDKHFNLDLDGDGIADITIDGHDINDNDSVDLWMLDADNDGQVDLAFADTNDNGIIDTVLFGGTSDDDSYDDGFDDDSDDDFFDNSDDAADEIIEPIDYDLPDYEPEPIDYDDSDDAFDASDDDSYDDDDIFSDDNDDDDIFDDEDDDDDIFDDEDDDFSEYDTYDETDTDDETDYDDDAGKLYGDPDTSDNYWEFQGNTNRCAIYSQKFAIEELTGQDLDIEEMADIAEDNGWFTEENGTPIVHMNKMLDYYGVENETCPGSDMNDIEEALANGEKVIVALDADEIWYGDDDSDDLYTPGDGVNHAVEVIGVDHTDPDNPVVILNDSGTPDGQGSRIPLEVFEDAWVDGNNHMIVCG